MPKVSELLQKRDQTNSSMEREHFQRIQTQLTNGAKLVFRAIVDREIDRNGGDLESLLEQHRDKLNYQLRSREQREKLHESYLDAWDISLLTGVILEVFRNSLSVDERDSIKRIKQRRNEISHRTSDTYDFNEYTVIREDLDSAFGTLLDGLNAEVEEKYTRIESIINRVSRNIQVVDTEVKVSGPERDADLVYLLEDIITTVMGQAIANVQENTYSDAVKRAALNILREITSKKDVELIEAKRGSVKLRFQCTSYIGLLKLLVYVDSDSFQKQLDDLATEVKKMKELKTTFFLSAKVTSKCLQKIIESLIPENMYSNTEIEEHEQGAVGLLYKSTHTEELKHVEPEHSTIDIENDDNTDTDDEVAEEFEDDAEAIMAGRKNLNKNAISAFEEYGVQHRVPPKVEVVSTSGPPHRPMFIAVAKLGDTEICSEQGHSKHEARIKAAERALQMLSVQNVGPTGDTEPSENQPSDSTEEDELNPVPYKDSVSALMEFAQFAKLEVSFVPISQEGPPHMPVFTMAVKLGEEVCPSVKGGSAKDAKKRAACVALNKLKRQGALQTLFPDTKASAMPIGKLKSKSTLGAPGKNPVSVLNEYAQKSSTRLRFESSQTGPPHKPVFTVWAVLGEENFPAVTAASKKEGNVLAAETVLKVLGDRGQYVVPKAVLGQQTATNNVTHTALTHHDRVAAAAVRKFDELLLQTPESLVGRKVIAAIVMMDAEQGLYRVVSVGSGNRCVKGSHISCDGTVLHDSHAEVLARRGFKRFLYWLLRTKDLPILVRGRQGKQRFKDGISFHLYISTAPCGDGALFTHSDRGVEGSSCLGSEHSPVFTNVRTQGLLRAKQENGEGTIPVEPEFVGQTYDGIQQGGRLRVMSCSDKICQWNVLGIQGALLSSVYEPVYLQSITLGNLFNAGHLARAVCCRIDYSSAPLQSQLPSSYHVNHPDLGVPSVQDATRVVEKARSLSINWCFGDKDPEITDGTIGKTVKTVDRSVGPSRLCKQSMFDLYRQTFSNNGSFTNVSYKQMKLDADDYNQAKMALHRRLQEQSYGYWVCMPREVDRFQ